MKSIRKKPQGKTLNIIRPGSNVSKIPRESSVTKFWTGAYYSSIMKAIGRHSQACKDSGKAQVQRLSSTKDGEMRSKDYLN